MTNAVDAVGTSGIALVTTISVTALHSLVNCETARQAAAAAGPVAAMMARAAAAVAWAAAAAVADSAVARQEHLPCPHK